MEVHKWHVEALCSNQVFKVYRTAEDFSWYLLQFDKYKLSQEFNIPYRDLRFIDPWVSRAVPAGVAHVRCYYL